jgi:hypothetical protein
MSEESVASAPLSDDNRTRSAEKRSTPQQPAAQAASDDSGAEGDDPMEAYMRMLAQQQQQQKDQDERMLDNVPCMLCLHSKPTLTAHCMAQLDCQIGYPLNSPAGHSLWPHSACIGGHRFFRGKPERRD